jgi:hypothetical protein
MATQSILTPKRRGRPPKQVSIPSQNATTELLEPVLAAQVNPRLGKSIKPPMVQAAVIAKYSNGESKTQIANDLGMGRNTVTAILSQSEIEQYVLEGRSKVVSLIPKAIRAVENRLDKNDGSVAIGVLRGTQVLVNQQNTTNVTNNFAVMLAQLEQTKQSDARDNDISTAIEVTAAK